jgi:regulatory protein
MKSLDIEAARVVAFRFLGYTARTRNEMEQRLLRDEFAPELVAQVIGELEGKGYLDDAGFARHWVEDRADRKKYGRVRLSAELNRKGIDRETAAAALDNIEEDDEVRRATQAAQSRWKAESLELLDMQALQKEKSRISGFLVRRGFSWQTIKKVLAELTENND